MIIVSTSPGEAYSDTAGVISMANYACFGVLTVLIKTLKQTRNAYEAEKRRALGS